MKRKLLEDVIIIAGEVNQKVDDDMGNECERCSLHGSCRDYLMFCETGKRYQKIGTIDDVLAKEQHRKEARHHLAVLIRHNRWRTDPNSIRSKVDSTAITEAIDFAIQELKEIYK